MLMYGGQDLTFDISHGGDEFMRSALQHFGDRELSASGAGFDEADNGEYHKASLTLLPGGELEFVVAAYYTGDVVTDIEILYVVISETGSMYEP